MANCYVWKGVGTDGLTYTFAACATNPNWKLAQLQPSGGGWYAPYDGGTQLIHWWSTAGEIALVQGAEALAAAQTGGGGNLGGCGGCLNNPPPSASKYDCINGACTVYLTYNTPGLYQSLSECEINCGLQGCSGVCISNADWATIQGLSNQLKNKNCS